MDEEILLSFLEIGVIDVGGDDTKLEKLRATVTELSAELIKTPAKVPAYTLVAVDPDIPATDPTIQEAMAVLRQHWTTVANTFSTTPVAIIRAMLLDAVVRTARQDDAFAVAFVNSARNALPYVESGNEQPIWKAVITELEAQVDKRAEAEWATPETITIEPFHYKAPGKIVIESSKWSANRDELKASVLRASGPHGGDHNPHWPSNQPQPWSTEFAIRLTTVLADTIEAAFAKAAPEPIDLSGPLNTLANAVTTHVGKALGAFSGATAGLQRRTNLLWWKEALYSPNAHASYRDLPAFSAAALMALDLHAQVPTYSPASVSAFLNEAIQALHNSTQPQHESVFTLIKAAQTDLALAPLREVAAKITITPVGRGPLLSLIGHINESTGFDAENFQRLCGVGANVMISPPAWGSWLFRELQAARATTTSSQKRT